MRERIAHRVLLLVVFFLPWQTQWIFTRALIAGESAGYGVLSVYVVELLILLAFVLRGRPRASQEVFRTWQALLFFLAVGFFSLALSQVPWVGWFHLLHVVSAGMFFVLLTDERTRLKKTLAFFLLGLLVPMLIGWSQVLSGSSVASTTLGMAAKDAETAGVAVVETLDGRQLRAYGTFPHPNIFGGYLAFGLLVLMCLCRERLTTRWFLAVIIASAVLGSTLIVTFSRSAWLGVLVASVFSLGGILWHKQKPSRSFIVVSIVAIVAIVLTIGGFYTQVFTRFNPTQRLEAISIQERTYQYQDVQGVVASAPILGVGPGAYTFTLAQQHPGQSIWEYQPIHNTFLLVLAELGVVGFVLFFFWLYRIDCLLPTRTSSFNGRMAMMLATMVFVVGLFDHYLWSFWPGLALGALTLGTIVSLLTSKTYE